MKQKAAAKRITHPYARYSNSGQLTCTICGVPVKSEVVWPAHLTSKVHRNNVRRERAEQERQQQQQQSSSAQDHQDDDVDVDIPPDRKRAANDDGEDGSTTAKRVRFSQDEEEESTVQDSNNALPPGFFDDPSAEAQASQASVNAGDVDDDEEWAAFEATLAAPDQPEASTSALNPFAAGATISAEEVLYEEKDDAQNNANGDADAAEEEEEEPQETEEQRKDREEREELMERIETWVVTSYSLAQTDF